MEKGQIKAKRNGTSRPEMSGVLGELVDAPFPRIPNLAIYGDEPPLLWLLWREFNARGIVATVFVDAGRALQFAAALIGARPAQAGDDPAGLIRREARDRALPAARALIAATTVPPINTRDIHALYFAPDVAEFGGIEREMERQRATYGFADYFVVPRDGLREFESLAWIPGATIGSPDVAAHFVADTTGRLSGVPVSLGAAYSGDAAESIGHIRWPRGEFSRADVAATLGLRGLSKYIVLMNAVPGEKARELAAAAGADTIVASGEAHAAITGGRPDVMHLGDYRITQLPSPPTSLPGVWEFAEHVEWRPDDISAEMTGEAGDEGSDFVINFAKIVGQSYRDGRVLHHNPLTFADGADCSFSPRFNLIIALIIALVIAIILIMSVGESLIGGVATRMPFAQFR